MILYPLVSDVKRPYSSTRRQEQARLTRRSILAAAADLFITNGYGATSLQQVADQAGVAVQTIYATFANKPTILEKLLDTAIAGDDEPVAVNDRDWMHSVFNDPDPAMRLHAYAAAVAGIHDRAGDLFGVLRAAAESEPTLAPLAATTEQRRRTGAASVVKGLENIGGLRNDLSTQRATDILWTLNSPDLFRRLVRDSGWSLAGYQEWLEEIMTNALVRSQ